MDLSIIIVNFRTFALTVDCIRSIKENTRGLHYEIILVDNAPLEENGSRFQALFPEVVYLMTTENIGFSRANNLGVTRAQGQYLLFLNSDTIVIENCIQKCHQFLKAPENAGIGLVGCKHLNADLSFQPSYYPFKRGSLWNFIVTDNPLLFKLYHVKERLREPFEAAEVEHVAGSFLFMRKEVVERVKAFDPDFFLYFEETEWCKVRIKKIFKITYLPSAKIIHLGGQSTPKNYLFPQFRLSQALLWYKSGLFNYLGYVIYCYFNIFFLLPFSLKKRNRGYFINYLTTYVYLFPYLFFEIPRYPRAYGSRKEMLIFKKAKKYFA